MKFIIILLILSSLLILFYNWFNIKEGFKNPSNNKLEASCCVELQKLKYKFKGQDEYISELENNIKKINKEKSFNIKSLNTKITKATKILQQIEKKMTKTSSDIISTQKDLIEKANYTSKTIKQIRSSAQKLKMDKKPKLNLK